MATIHYGDNETPDVLKVGASFVVRGERYALTPKGLNTTIRELVHAGYLAPTDSPGHYQATVPAGVEC